MILTGGTLKDNYQILLMESFLWAYNIIIGFAFDEIFGPMIQRVAEKPLLDG